MKLSDALNRHATTWLSFCFITWKKSLRMTRTVEYLKTAQFYCWIIALVRGNARENNARSMWVILDCRHFLVFRSLHDTILSSFYLIIYRSIFYLSSIYLFFIVRILFCNYFNSVNYLILCKLFVILLEKIVLAKFEKFQ